MNKQILLLLLVVLIPVAGFGQPGDPGNPDVPITGIEFLLGGGAILGIRAMLRRIKSKQE